MTGTPQAIEKVLSAHAGSRIAVCASGYLTGQAVLAKLFGKLKPALSDGVQAGAFYIDTAGYLVADLSAMGFGDLNFTVMAGAFDVAVVLIEASFGAGQKEHWVRFLSGLSGIGSVVVCVDSADEAEWNSDDHESLYDSFLPSGEFVGCEVHVIPVCIETGGNLRARDAFQQWYDGPCLDEVLAKSCSETPNNQVEYHDTQRSDQFSVYMCWLASEPVVPGRSFVFEHHGQRAQMRVSSLKYRLNPQTLDHQAATLLHKGQVGYANIALDDEISFDVMENGGPASSFKVYQAETGALLAFGFIKHGLRRATNIKWHDLQVDKKGRAAAKGQRPCVLWFTGLSGSGKSSIATLMDKKLHAAGKHTFVLDGDNVRHGLCRDLGFTEAERVENIRRISEVAKLLVESGLIVLVSFISPFAQERQSARALFDEGEFVEIFVDTSLEVCEARDPKGLYKKARAGEIVNFTGLDSPYERPTNAEIVLPGDELSAEAMADMVIDELNRRGLVPEML